MRIVTLTSLFPNPAQPTHGLFVAERLRHLLDSGRIEARIVAPVPWFPFKHERFGQYARFASVPRTSQWQGREVRHPRYPVVPGPGWYATPWTFALAARRALRQLEAEGYQSDLIDAHYYYPDGVAAALVGRWTGKPVVISARGTDINLIPRYPIARRMVRWAALQASRTIAVSSALRDALSALDVPAERIVVLRNGVDLARFRPRDRDGARGRYALAGPTLLSVGNLIELKGHRLVIEALAALPDWTLLIAGHVRTRTSRSIGRRERRQHASAPSGRRAGGGCGPLQRGRRADPGLESRGHAERDTGSAGVRHAGDSDRGWRHHRGGGCAARGPAGP